MCYKIMSRVLYVSKPSQDAVNVCAVLNFSCQDLLSSAYLYRESKGFGSKSKCGGKVQEPAMAQLIVILRYLGTENGMASGSRAKFKIGMAFIVVLRAVLRNHLYPTGNGGLPDQ